ncbi:TonB-dependent receptor [Pasteurellaceae bacterium LIM206]|nr:TonB-dependent receptor [Pasteurellaceae bacterium LIM206]
MKKTLLCTAIAMACTQLYAEETFQLGKIEVVANGSTDTSVAVVEQEQLRQNQVTNVARVVKMVPGVSFERKGARNEQNILVRGFGANRVPVFIDGIPVYVPYDGNMDLGRFTTFDLSQINISKGASSVLYGPNTLGGAINLVSQKPTKEFEGTLGYGFQTGRSGHTAGNQAYFNLGTKQELFYAQISGSFLEKQGLQLSKNYHSNGNEDGGRAENSVNRDKKLSLKVAYTPNSTDEYTFTFTTQRGKKQQPIYAGYSSAIATRYWRWPAWNKDSAYFLSHTEFADGKYYLNGKLFYDRFKNDLTLYDNDTFTTGSSSFYRDYSFGGGLEFGANINASNLLKLSALYKADVHKEHDDDDPVARDEDRTYSLGAEYTYRFSDKTNIVTGASFDRREARQAENYQQLSLSSKKKGLYQFDTADKNAFNYQIKFNHSFSDNDGFSASYAHKTRFATMKERYSRTLRRNRVPNPFLKPEVADHYELSYYRTFADRFKLEGALFYSRVKDAIEEVYTGNITNINGKNVKEVMNKNVGTETFTGVELGLAYFAGDNLTLGANYSYIRAKNKDDDSVVIQDVPKHKFFAYADWKFMPSWSLYVSQSIESGRFASDGNGYVKLSGFGVTDAKIGYAFNQNFSVDVGVSNIFDKNYYYTEGYPEEGRIYFTNLKYTF